MEKLLNKRFTTSQFADMHGVNKRTLMYYDEIGLFQPAYIGENGYRYYNFKQNLNFEAILLLRKLRVPLKDIKRYLKSYTQDNLLELLYAQEQQLDMQIAELKRLKRIVRNRINNIESNRKIDFNKIEVVEVEKIPIVLSESFADRKSEQLFNSVSSFMKDCYHSRTYSGHPIGIITDVYKLKKGDYKPIAYGFYVVDEIYEQEPNLAYKPKGRYLVGYHIGDWRKINETYEKLMTFATEKKLTFGQYSYEERLFDDISPGKNESPNYFEIRISILLK